MSSEYCPDQMDCQLRIRGHLDSHWADRFAGLDMTLEDNGDTLLTGTVADLVALIGLLRKVRDLGIPLHSVISCAGGKR